MLGSSDEPIPFLNPDTYLNHLSPSESTAIEFRDSIRLLILGAALWDVLAYLDIDIRIVRTSRFSFVIFCFIFSRFFALVTLAGFAAIYIVSGCFAMLSLTMSSFLFLQRVLAVYYESSKWVRRAFSVFWVVASTSDVLITFGGHPFSKIPAFQGSGDSGIAPWVAISAWCSFAFDTVITLAISYKLWSTHMAMVPENQNFPWYHLVSGKTLPLVSRLVFMGGLQYYLIIIWAVLMVGITLWIPSVPQLYKITLPSIQIFLTCSMASRVYRNLKLKVETGASFTGRHSVV